MTAYGTGTLVAIADLTDEDRWPGYRQVAREDGIHAVAAVPMRLGEQTAGALNLYNEDPRAWTAEDLDAAKVLANMATAYLINASQQAQQQQLTEQLQRALDSRVIIEQAKGMLANAQGISTTEAFERLRRHARSHHARVHDVATAVVALGLRI